MCCRHRRWCLSLLPCLVHFVMALMFIPVCCMLKLASRWFYPPIRLATKATTTTKSTKHWLLLAEDTYQPTNTAVERTVHMWCVPRDTHTHESHQRRRTSMWIECHCLFFWLFCCDSRHSHLCIQHWTCPRDTHTHTRTHCTHPMKP